MEAGSSTTFRLKYSPSGSLSLRQRDSTITIRSMMLACSVKSPEIHSVPSMHFLDTLL